MERELVYDGWMKLYKEKINGKWYEILDNHDAVSALVLDKEGKILLVEQYRPAMGRNTLEIPAGVIDKPGLSKEEIMSEELMEEAGLEVSPGELEEIILFRPIVGFSKSKTYIYKVGLDIVGKDKIIEDDDVIAIRWLDPTTFRNMIKDQIIQDNKTLMAFFYHDK
jgi:ADP-ribose pyrophosphatase